jgi:hypothetical protein
MLKPPQTPDTALPSLLPPVLLLLLSPVSLLLLSIHCSCRLPASGGKMASAAVAASDRSAMLLQ